jgi:hypothetical protein
MSKKRSPVQRKQQQSPATPANRSAPSALDVCVANIRAKGQPTKPLTAKLIAAHNADAWMESILASDEAIDYDGGAGLSGWRDELLRAVWREWCETKSGQHYDHPLDCSDAALDNQLLGFTAGYVQGVAIGLRLRGAR